MNRDSKMMHFDLQSMIVRHERTARRFAVRLDKKIGYLSYEKPEPRILDYAHVYVPPEFRNKGIADKLTQTALDYARENNFSVIPSCSYVAMYVRKHKKYRDILVNPG
ncbi:MAG: GNAT family N-acetyltransferase [Candidatus Aminicenantes bacterium]|nr:GNAT family N-acetyltransferase [Candidatus Aminicenantes bacterium]